MPRLDRARYRLELLAERYGVLSPRPSSLQAAGQNVSVGGDEVMAVLKRREKWQPQTWQAVDAVGPLKYALNLQANAQARIRILPGRRSDEPNEPPLPLDGTGRWDDLVIQVTELLGDHGEIERRLHQQLSIPGDGWLVGTQEDNGNERWRVRSQDEIYVKNDRVYEREAPGEAGEELPAEDRAKPGQIGNTSLIRVWQEHARYYQMSDSQVRGVLEAVDELLIINRAFRAQSRQRIAANGILAYPDDLEFPQPVVTGEEDQGAENRKPKTLAKMLQDAYVAAIRDEDSVSSVAPAFLRYKHNDLRKSGIEHIDIQRTIDENLFKRADWNLHWIGLGINMPVEKMFGLGGATHWGAGQIEQSDYSEHVEPANKMLLSALTRAYLRPRLVELGMPSEEAERYLFLPDTSDLIVHPDLEQAADFGLLHGGLGFAGWRQLRGIPESMAPDDVELALIIAINQALRTAGPVVSLPGDIATEAPVDPTAAPADPNAQPAVAASVDPQTLQIIRAAVRARNGHRSQPRSEDLGQQLAAIDITLLERVIGAADAATRRALERAGQRVLTHARKDATLKDVLRDVPPLRIAHALGPDKVRSLVPGDLLVGAFEDVGNRFAKWCDAAARKALDLVVLEPHARDAAEAQLQDTTSQAARWLADELSRNAHELLYEPDRRPLPGGESDETLLVPTRIVREALARAGGGGVIHGGIKDVLGSAAKRLLLATGPIVRGAFKLAGYIVGRFSWLYGPIPRNAFEPHQLLDGAEFDSFDDDVLANVEGWPDSEFYFPGDHAGCCCIAIPNFSGPDVDSVELSDLI